MLSTQNICAVKLADANFSVKLNLFKADNELREARGKLKVTKEGNITLLIEASSNEQEISSFV